jgi:hypothetical protein
MSAVNLHYRGVDNCLCMPIVLYLRMNTSSWIFHTRVPFNQQVEHDCTLTSLLTRIMAARGLLGYWIWSSCCWATRLITENYVLGTTDLDRNLAIFFQDRAEGIGSNFGQNSDSLLEIDVFRLWFIAKWTPIRIVYCGLSVTPSR